MVMMLMSVMMLMLISFSMESIGCYMDFFLRTRRSRNNLFLTGKRNRMFRTDTVRGSVHGDTVRRGSVHGDTVHGSRVHGDGVYHRYAVLASKRTHFSPGISPM